MTSSVKDFSIPDVRSAEQNQDMNEDCRLKKVPSNEVDMLEDSSAVEYVGATCGLKDNEKQSTASASKNFMAGTGNIATVKSLVPLNQSSIIYDEETLMKMTDEELQFFENYKRENMPSLKCTICPCQLSFAKWDNIRIHPFLGVLVCKSCHELYSNCPFTKDENGYDKYCRLCAEVGIFICCDTCTNVFCKACLGRVNFLEIISSKCKWSCFVCNNLPLWSQRALCRMVMLMMKSTPGRKSLSRRSLQDSQLSPTPKRRRLQNEVLNGKESEESMLKKQVDRLVKSPIEISSPSDKVSDDDGSMKLPTTSSIPDRNEGIRLVCYSDSDLDLDTEETENIPDEVSTPKKERTSNHVNPTITCSPYDIGLRNIDNTCYVNATLQALFAQQRQTT